MRTVTIAANGLTFETLTAGDPTKPLLHFLHGFPEHAGAWADIMPAFADSHFCVAPNQRGYGRSSKPAGVENYKAQHLAADMLALAEAVAPGRPITLVAHDWGASVGYMMAFMAPKRIARLVVINGVHPVPFQRAILNDPAQRAASQYIRFLRRDDSAARLAENGHARLLGFLTKGFGGAQWLSEAKRQAYLAAWSEPGAVEAMVSWYKATPLVVPEIGEVVTDDAMARLPADRVRVAMAHLVIWGLGDKALLAVTRAGLEAFCGELQVVEIAGADHWIIHQQPDAVVEHIRRFVDGV